MRVIRSRSKFRTARAAWADIHRVRGIAASRVLRTAHTAKFWVFVLRDKNARKVKVRRAVRKAAVKRSRNPRAGGRGYNRAVKLYRDFHGEHPRFVDEYELASPDVGVYIGPCDGIMYTAKIDGKTERLVHEFTGKSRPIFAVSADGRDILLLGGDFKFTERGLVDGV